MRSSLAEAIVAAIVFVWLASVVAAMIDPDRAEIAITLAPIMGTVAGGAVAALAISRRRDGNGKNGGTS